MPSAQKITSRIIEEAQQTAEAIVAEAKVKANENLTTAQKQADEILKQAAQEATNSAAELEKHKLSAIESELRKEVLSVRRKLLDSVFAAALDKLAFMQPEDKIAIMAPRIVEASPDGQGEILLTKQDADQFGPQLLDTVHKQYEAKGINPQLKLSTENVKARGGFILRNGNIEYNNTFETSLKSWKKELENQVAAILFADEVRGQD